MTPEPDFVALTVRRLSLARTAPGGRHGTTPPTGEDPEIQRKQAERSAAMSPHVDTTVSDGSYRVIEVITRDEARRGSSPG
jgi:hypothetical protein